MATIRAVRQTDHVAWTRMREELWPNSAADSEQEIAEYFALGDDNRVTFVAEEGGELVGFLEARERSYAEGCVTEPVAYVEGWFVDAGSRGKGIGRALVEVAETWARKAGYGELASDAELENAGSQAAHAALGFEEVGRSVHFRRELAAGEAPPEPYEHVFVRDTFRFENEVMQGKLVELYGLFDVIHTTTESGELVVDDSRFELLIDSLQALVRSWRFPDFFVKCLRDSADDDDAHMRRVVRWLEEQGMSYELELHNGECWALLPEAFGIERALEELE